MSDNGELVISTFHCSVTQLILTTTIVMYHQEKAILTRMLPNARTNTISDTVKNMKIKSAFKTMK